MSKFEKLNVDIRKEHGTSAARRTRLQNKVPAVVYHSGVEATPLSVDKISLNKALKTCLLYTSPSPRDRIRSRMPSSA